VKTGEFSIVNNTNAGVNSGGVFGGPMIFISQMFVDIRFEMSIITV